MLAQLTEGAVGHNVLFYIIQIVTLVLLSLAANAWFAGTPVLAGLLAHDNFLPHVFGLRADREGIPLRRHRAHDRPRCCSSWSGDAQALVAVRGRGIHRLHPVPDGDGEALVLQR